MPTNPVRTAPVATVSTVEAVIGAVLTLLVAHHVIPADVAATYGPLVVVALVMVFGAVKWQNVTPVVKVEALAGRLAAEIADAQNNPTVQAVEQAVKAALVPEAPSAQAGAVDAPAPAEPAPLVTGTLAPPQTPVAAPEPAVAAPEPPAAPVA